MGTNDRAMTAVEAVEKAIQLSSGKRPVEAIPEVTRTATTRKTTK